MPSSEIIATIRERVDIVAVASEHMRLIRRGRSLVGLCPFHAEKTPSFNLNPANKFFHCFGCGESGDVFTLVMRLEGMDFAQAVAKLAQSCGVVLSTEDHEQDAVRVRAQARNARMHTLMNDACSFFEAQLAAAPASSAAARMLLARGVTPRSIAEFRLGWAPDSWDALGEYLRSKGYTPAEAEALGLLVPRQRGTGTVDRFRNRLMFPVRALSGTVIAFSGRRLNDGDDAKYINSPQTPLYRKGEVLYGLYEARVALRRYGEAVLCEGNFDLVALHQAGVQTALAPMGTALTADHVRWIRRFAQRVVLFFDGDAAGRQAVRNAYPLLQAQGLTARVVGLSDHDDPDSWLRAHDSTALQLLLVQARGLAEYLIDESAETTGTTAAERAAAVEALLPIVQSARNSVEREILMQRIAQRFALPDLAAMRRQFRQREALSDNVGSATPKKLAIASAHDKLPEQQADLVGLVLDHPTLLHTPEATALVGFVVPELQAVLEAATRVIDNSGQLDAVALCQILAEHCTASWLRKRLASPHSTSPQDAPIALRNGLALIATRYIERELNELHQAIARAYHAGDASLVRALTEKRQAKQRVALRWQIQQPSSSFVKSPSR